MGTRTLRGRTVLLGTRLTLRPHALRVLSDQAGTPQPLPAASAETRMKLTDKAVLTLSQRE